MKRFAMTAAFLVLASGAAFAASPDTMISAVLDCCEAIAACCGTGMPCCP